MSAPFMFSRGILPSLLRRWYHSREDYSAMPAPLALKATLKKRTMGNLVTVILCTHFLLVVGMFAENPEWEVIKACSVGGFIGGLGGVILSLFATPTDWKWHICLIRWVLNAVTSTVGAPFAYWYLHGKYFVGKDPSPILAILCGGVVGMFFIVLLQPFLPRITVLLQKRFDNLVKRLWPDEVTPSDNSERKP